MSAGINPKTPIFIQTLAARLWMAYADAEESGDTSELQKIRAAIEAKLEERGYKVVIHKSPLFVESIKRVKKKKSPTIQ